MIITRAPEGTFCRHPFGNDLHCGKPAAFRYDHPGLKPDWLCAGCAKKHYPRDYSLRAGEVSRTLES